MNNNINPLLLCDFYKVGHVFQYPENTSLVYSNFTPRKSRIPGVDKIVFFGLQGFLKEFLIERFNRDFFNLTEEEAVNRYKELVESGLGRDVITYDHIRALHKLGYLPIHIKGLPEGAVVPIRVPVLTIFNTLPEFYWLPNFLETLLSAQLWQSCTSATIAYEYRKILDKFANVTSTQPALVDWQGHDFSMRGMGSVESAMLSGAGHLLSFTGTDTVPAIWWLNQYYNVPLSSLIGGSVPATEHSVMCAGEMNGEFETFRRLLTEVYPKGILSIVSDTWDLWKVLTEYLPRLRDIISNREGKLVIRPDSGDPAKILTGYKVYNSMQEAHDEDEAFYDGKSFYRVKCLGNVYSNGGYDDKLILGEQLTSSEVVGVVETLFGSFGGTRNKKGYIELAHCVGTIYGDSITLERCKAICERLKAKGFASTNVVFGIGSYTYQHNTRDTLGFAMKATYVEVSQQGRNIYKDPATDDGTKKSAKGLLQVIKDASGGYELKDQVSWQEEASGELQTVFLNGKLVRETSLDEIRQRLKTA